MQPERFDALSRFLATQHSRRVVLRAMVGAAVGGLLGRPLISVSVAAAAASDAPAAAGTCTLTTGAATSPATLAFTAQVRGMVVTGSGHVNLRGLDSSLSLTMTRAGATVFRFNGTMAGTGVYTAVWHFGNIVKGARQLTLITRDGKHVSGTIDGRKLISQVGGKQPLRFTDGTQVPKVVFPAGVSAALNRARTATRQTIAACKQNTGLASTRAVSHGDPTYGTGGHFDNPGQEGPCEACIAEAYAGAAGCAAACAASLGFACGCVAGVPLLFANCHTAGQGLGQGCCPVGCGPSHSTLGLGVVYQCCSGNDTCLNSTSGSCCSPGLQACNGTVCCPSNAPCRDVGICCPTNQATCISAGQPVCCNPGEECTQGMCCPTGSAVCNGTCCDSKCHQCQGGSCVPLPNGTTCDGGVCCNGTCAACCGFGATCNGNGACCSGYCGQGSTCDCFGPGDECRLGSKSCCSGMCSANGLCCVGINSTCGSPSDCCSGFCNQGNKCDCFGTGDECRLGPQSCCSGVCGSDGICK